NTPVNPPSNVPQTIAHPLLINGVNAVLISIAMIAINPYLISFFTGGISRPINNAYSAIPMLSLSWSGITSPSIPPRKDVITQVRYPVRSEEHTSELQSRFDLVCRLLLVKKKIQILIDLLLL